MTSRRKSREIALQVLYQMEFDSNLTPKAGLRLFSSHFEHDSQDYDYSLALIEGVQKSKTQIDELIQKNTKNWKLDRISHVDRNILRIACLELLNFKQDVPPRVCINEAIEVAKKFGTEDSNIFVNGILDQISKSL